jgi:hypothetical protein
MSCAARRSEPIVPTSFANSLAIVVERILTACGIPPTRNDTVQFVIPPPVLTQPDILDYSSGIGVKTFSKASEPIKIVFSVKNPNMRIFLNELQIRSESFGWNPLFQINISQET